MKTNKALFIDAEPTIDQLAIGSWRDFPSTRYYGSKMRQLDWLADVCKPIHGQTVLDAFGGTGAVSHMWRSLGWQVTYNDAFTFNTISAKAIFSNSTRMYPESLVHSFLNSVQPINGFISQTFKGMYFLPAENRWLDGLLNKLEDQKASFRYLLLHCLFQACLQKRPYNLFHRANLNMRLFDGEVKFGNRKTWAKSFLELMLVAHREVAHVQSSTKCIPVHVAPPNSAMKVRGIYDVIYIDPPYFKRSGSAETYLRRYHFLEGLSRYKEWPELIDQQSSIKQIKEGTVSEWSSKNEFLENLVNLIEKHQKSQVILSYVSDAFPNEDDLIQVFKNNFSGVEVSRRTYSRALTKNKACELIIVGKR